MPTHMLARPPAGPPSSLSVQPRPGHSQPALAYAHAGSQLTRAPAPAHPSGRPLAKHVDHACAQAKTPACDPARTTVRSCPPPRRARKHRQALCHLRMADASPGARPPLACQRAPALRGEHHRRLRLRLVETSVQLVPQHRRARTHPRVALILGDVRSGLKMENPQGRRESWLRLAPGAWRCCSEGTCCGRAMPRLSRSSAPHLRPVGRRSART